MIFYINEIWILIGAGRTKGMLNLKYKKGEEKKTRIRWIIYDRRPLFVTDFSAYFRHINKTQKCGIWSS